MLMSNSGFVPSSVQIIQFGQQIRQSLLHQPDFVVLTCDDGIELFNFVIQKSEPAFQLIDAY